MCTPVHLPREEFDRIKPFLDSMIKGDGHYKKFEEVYGTETEDCRPSKQAKPKKLPFYASIQLLKNSGLMLMCQECGMWRLLYAFRKLCGWEKKVVEGSLDGLSFSCGSQLKEVDLDLPVELLSLILVRDLQRTDNVDICIHCCANIESSKAPKEYYPRCEDCVDKDKTKGKNTKK